MKCFLPALITITMIYFLPWVGAKQTPAETSNHIAAGEEITPTPNAYILLAWNEHGVHLMTDCDANWIMLPPGNTIHAQLLKRGNPPEFIMKHVQIHYRVEPGYEKPSERIRFWDFTRSFNGKQILRDAGLTGNRLTGFMIPDISNNRFDAKALPLIPYTSDNDYKPLPRITVTALDDSGKELAQTVLVSPVTTEWGCYHCHTGAPRIANRAGITDTTALNILATHDRLSHTHLAEKNNSGRSVWCQSCHGDPSVGMDGTRHLLNLSAAIHGYHASIETTDGAITCTTCHTTTAPSTFNTGLHAIRKIECSDCHGTMAQHAFSLLKMEKRYGKKTARPLLNTVTQKFPEQGLSNIMWRDPWLNQPDCSDCHTKNKQRTEQKTNRKWIENERDLYRNRKDPSGLYCAACHGAMHVMASPPPGHFNHKYCLTCHETQPLKTDFHHSEKQSE